MPHGRPGDDYPPGTHTDDSIGADGGARAPFPAGTYRLQLRGTPGEGHFGFPEAAALTPYLTALGVSHVYLSPVLRAAPGSTHGYDVVDHGRLAESLGGLEAFLAMAARFDAHGLRLLVDVVPNHMAIPHPETLNAPLADVAANGASSPYARWFDVDWEAGGGRLVLPAEGEPNYRRFFDISGLIALRQEDPEVFERTHETLLRFVAGGMVHGLRIDHPDGLADPRAYLERLAARAPDAWILVEKITTGEERLPDGWACAGTTGYDALGMVGGLFLDPDGEKPLTDLYVSATGGPASFDGVEYEGRRHAAAHGLRPEVARLHRVLCRALGVKDGDARRDGLERVLVELLAAMPVYRAYVVPGEDAPADAVAVLERAAEGARSRLPDGLHADLDAVVRLALGSPPPGGPEGGDDGGEGGAAREFVVRFQQTSAPIAAKGVEDTAFYRWNRLASLNEVGGDPGRFAVSPDDFHAYCERGVQERPFTMTTLSTHDTKRQEDVRARLAVLAEMPGAWAQAVSRWQGWRPDEPSPLEPDLDYLFWQTLVGAWPVGEGRLWGYLQKAMREAKTRTSWLEQDEAYEEAVLRHAGSVLGDRRLTADVTGFVAELEPYARVNTLGQKIVQLTMPGVPDVYQGCELYGLDLTDPDNRRPVDYGRRRARLHRLDTGRALRDRDDEKLLVTSRTLRLRRDRPEWYGPAGGYRPLAAEGPAAGHAVAFWRGGALTVATRLPAGLERRGGWAGTALDLGYQGWRDALTGNVFWGPVLDVADVLADLPVALLVPKEMR